MSFNKEEGIVDATPLFFIRPTSAYQAKTHIKVHNRNEIDHSGYGTFNRVVITLNSAEPRGTYILTPMIPVTIKELIRNWYENIR